MSAELLHRLAPAVALGLNLLLLGAALAADRKSPRARLFAYFVSAQAVWDFGALGLRWASAAPEALTWERIIHLGVIPLPVLFYHYVLAFLDLPRRSRALAVGYLLCAAFAVSSTTDLFIRGVTPTPWGFAPVSGPAYQVFFLYFQTYFVAGLIRLVLAYRTQDSSFRRNRTLLVMLGVGVSLLGGAVDFLRFILDWAWVYPVGIPSNAVLAVTLGVAIVRYRLMDISALAKRLVLYVLTATALAPVLIVGLWIVDALTPDELTPGNRLTSDFRYPLALLVTVVLALPILRKLAGGLDRLMFQRRHGVRDTLIALSKEMSAVLDMDSLGETLTRGLVTRIPVMHASLYLRGESGAFIPASRTPSPVLEAELGPAGIDASVAMWLRITGRTLVAEEIVFPAVAGAPVRAALRALEAERVALLVPLFLERELAGILVVGEKLSGEIFDPDEIELLETLMGQTAVALKNSRLYADLRRQMEELRAAQEQLVQAAKLAAIGELAASVAHEVNSPLTVVLGETGILLREAEAGSTVHRRLSNIEAEANRAGKITRDLVDFSRRWEYEPGPVQVQAVALRALEFLRAKLARAPVQTRVELPPDLPAVLGLGDQLLQVFLNLITNAIDAMPDGGTLVLRGEAPQASSGTVALSVSDSGVGMTPEQAARIFEPFYTTKPAGQGTGLGLSVTLGIVRRHGGAIEVQSEPGKGTTMIVRLPVAASESSRHPSPGPGGPSPATLPRPTSPSAGLNR